MAGKGGKHGKYWLMCTGLVLGWGNDPKWILVMTVQLLSILQKIPLNCTFQWEACIAHGLFLKKDMFQGTGLKPKETVCAMF